MKPNSLPLLLALTAGSLLAQAQRTPTMTDNPLLKPFATPHHTAPYDQLKPDQFLPALKESMARGRQEIEAIANNGAKPGFENTIVALDNAGELVGRTSAILFHLNGAETTPDLQKVVKEASPLLTEYGNDITLNPKLFARVKAVYNERARLKLDPESAMLLEKTYKRFARNGANLDEPGKARLREISAELSRLSIEFSEHNLAETNAYTLVITDEKDLAGLPDFAREGAKAAAKKAGKEGYVFTLQQPSYVPFMTYADNRELRKKLFLAYNGRGFQNDANDNRVLIAQIVKLRQERANLLGYKTHADFVLEESMAGSAQKVNSFLEDLVNHSRPAAERELTELTAFAKKLGFPDDKLQRWDAAYYSEKLKKEKFAISDEQLKPYFKLENVIQGAFELANRLYGLTFREVKNIPVWNPEVKTYEVFDTDGKFLAVFYGDYFPRPGKRAGAWMNAIQDQKNQGGENVRPHVVNVCNFTRPTDTKPSLLTMYEVRTLFHEFGHGLHGMLANGKYESLSGTAVYRDFVELPSQVMENFVQEPEVLALFARHYQTGEPLPTDYLAKIKASANFLAGLASLRQLNFGLIDMAWHGTPPTGEPVDSLERRITGRVELYPIQPGTAVSPAFQHIFAGGYSAGYYSYKWSEVLDADAFEAFKEKGLFNKQVADSFRTNVLSKGGSEKPDELYRRFRGRDPKPDAMLRRAGLIQ
jgi:peptidyl-dipeptidase Dcp